MVNEAGQFPQVCKKSMQAMVGDMQAPIPAEFWRSHGVAELRSLTPRELETVRSAGRADAFRRGQTHYTPIDWPEALDRIAAHTQGDTAGRDVLVRQRPQLERGGFPAAAVRPGLRHQQRQQRQLLLPQRQQRRAEQRHRQRHGDHRPRRPRARRCRLRHRRQPGQQSSAADAHADPCAASRRPRGGHQPGRRDRPGQLRFAGRRAQPAVRQRDRQPLRPAAHRRRPGAADGRGEADRRDGCDRRAVPRAALQRLARARATACGAVPWEEICAKSGVSRDEITAIAEVYAGGRNVVFAWTMGITHHTHGVENVQAIANLALDARHGRPAARRAAADPRPLQRAGCRLRRRHAEAEGRRLRAAAIALRRTTADDAGPRHHGGDGGRGRRAAEGRVLPRRQSVRLEPRRRLRPRRPVQPAAAGAREHHAEHRARQRAWPQRPSSCRFSRATKNRSRRRRSRCSTMSG